MDSSRRTFMETLLATAALGAEAHAMQKPSSSGIPTRPLGKTGINVPIIGLGGWDAVAALNDDDAVTLMHAALDGGITFWDNCWEYHDGRAETVMGKALQGRRDKVFLMTKICARDYEGYKRHLDDALRRLQTDHVDLLQFHALQYDGDVERIFDPEKGAAKAALEAKKAGKTRFLGFTGHMYPAVHKKMLEQNFPYDTVQMPLNILDAHYSSFQSQILPIARQKNLGVLGMKSLGAQNGRIPRDTGISWEECRRYAMSLPISSLICGIQTREQLDGMLRIARDFKPMPQDEIKQLLSRSLPPSKNGTIEVYKDMASGFGCSYHSRMLKTQNA